MIPDESNEFHTANEAIKTSTFNSLQHVNFPSEKWFNKPTIFIHGLQDMDINELMLTNINPCDIKKLNIKNHIVTYKLFIWSIWKKIN